MYHIHPFLHLELVFVTNNNFYWKTSYTQYKHVYGFIYTQDYYILLDYIIRFKVCCSQGRLFYEQHSKCIASTSVWQLVVSVLFTSASHGLQERTSRIVLNLLLCAFWCPCISSSLLKCWAMVLLMSSSCTDRPSHRCTSTTTSYGCVDMSWYFIILYLESK